MHPGDLDGGRFSIVDDYPRCGRRPSLPAAPLETRRSVAGTGRAEKEEERNALGPSDDRRLMQPPGSDPRPPGTKGLHQLRYDRLGQRHGWEPPGEYLAVHTENPADGPTSQAGSPTTEPHHSRGLSLTRGQSWQRFLCTYGKGLSKASRVSSSKRVMRVRFSSQLHHKWPSQQRAVASRADRDG
jgi:hypothetical protein